MHCVRCQPQQQLQTLLIQHIRTCLAKVCIQGLRTVSFYVQKLFLEFKWVQHIHSLLLPAVGLCLQGVWDSVILHQTLLSEFKWGGFCTVFDAARQLELLWCACRVFGTVSYYVQKLFSEFQGVRYVQSTVTTPEGDPRDHEIAASASCQDDQCSKIAFKVCADKHQLHVYSALPALLSACGGQRFINLYCIYNVALPVAVNVSSTMIELCGQRCLP